MWRVNNFLLHNFPFYTSLRIDLHSSSKLLRHQLYPCLLFYRHPRFHFEKKIRIFGFNFHEKSIFEIGFLIGTKFCAARIKFLQVFDHLHFLYSSDNFSNSSHSSLSNRVQFFKPEFGQKVEIKMVSIVIGGGGSIDSTDSVSRRVYN